MTIREIEIPVGIEARTDDVLRTTVLDGSWCPPHYECDSYLQITGTAARGWGDPAAIEMISSMAEQAQTAQLEGECPWTVLGEPLRPENRAALAFLKEWMSTPDEMGDEWWEEFEAELRTNRLSFGDRT